MKPNPNTPLANRTRPGRISLTTLAALALALAGTQTTRAASATWNGTENGLWSNANNWSASPAPGTGDTATFDNAGAGNTILDLGAGVSLTSLLFNPGAAAYTIGSGAVGSQVLTLDNAGSVTVSSGVANNQLLNANLTLSPTANAVNSITHVGNGTLTLAGGINAVPAAGNSLLLVTNTSGVTISGPVTETGAGSLALLKTGTGTLTITTNSVWSGNAALARIPATSVGAPLVVREGRLLFKGGTNTVTGEPVIGGVVTDGGPGQNAAIVVDGSRLDVSSWFSVGRGNGVGGVSSDLVATNGAVITAANISAGFNGGNAANLTKGSITLSDTSSFTITGNGTAHLAESAGSDFTMTMSGSSVFTAAGTGEKNLGYNGKLQLNIKDSSSMILGNQITYIGREFGTGIVTVANSGKLNMSGELRLGGSSVNGAGRNAYGLLTVDGGTVNLSSLTAGRGNDVNNKPIGELVVLNGGVVNITNDSLLGFAGAAGSYGKITVNNGGKVRFAVTGTRWLSMNQWDYTDGIIEVNNGGEFQLLYGSSIKFVRGASNLDHTNRIDMNGGALTCYVDGGTNVNGATGNIDMQTHTGNYPLIKNVLNLNGGVLTIGDIRSSGSSSTRIINFNGGTLRPAATDNRALITISGATARLNVRNGGAIIDTDGKNTAILGVLWHSDIDGDNAIDGGLTKIGNGTLWLTNGTTYTGPTTVRGGTLNLNPSAVSYGNVSALTVSNATLALTVIGGGNYVQTDTVALQNNAAISLTYGALGGNPSQPVILSSGALSAPGANIVINFSGTGFTSGSFPVIDYTGTPLANVANFSLGSVPPGVVAVVSNNTANTSVDVHISQATQLLTWYGADNLNNPLTTWDINTSANWNSGNLKYLEYGSYGDIVTFDDSALNPNVTLNTTVIPALVTFANDGHAYSISGSGSIGGAAVVTKNNTGTLALNTANTYTGGTVINGGTVIITNNNALGAPAGAVSLGGATLQANASLTTARPLTLTGAATLGVASGATAQWGGVISGTSSLSKTDNGTLTLTAPNTLTGNVWVKGGNLTVDSGGAISNTTWTSIGQTGSDVGAMTLKGTGAFITTADFNVADIDTTTGTLDIQDSATLTANNLFVSSANNVGSSANGTVNQTGGTVTQVSTAIGAFAIGGRRDTVDGSPVGVYNLSGGTVIANAGIRVGGNGTGTINQNGGLIQARGGINVARFAGATGTNNLNGGILETFNVASSTGSNAFFNFNGGTLKAYTNNAAFFTGLTRANVRDNGGVIDTAGFDITIAQALLASDIPGDAGTGGLTKIGNGTLTLTGTNGYAGPTRLGGGKLIVNPAHKVTGPLTVSNATTFAVSLPTTNGAAQVGALTLGTGATTLEFNYGTNLNSATPILVTGALTNNGTCTIRITGTFAVGVIPLIDYTGTIQGGGTFTPQFLAPVGVVASYSNSVANSMIYAVISQVGAGLVWTGTNAVNPNVWDINVTTNWLFGANPMRYSDGDPVSFNDVGSGTVNLSNTVNPISLLISNTAVNYSFSGPGAISGTTGLRKEGSGTALLNFTGNNYTGPTIVSNGILATAGGGAIGDQSPVILANASGVGLAVTNGETIGSLAGGGATGGNVILGSGELIVGGNNTTTAFDGNLSGAGSFRKLGTGTMSLGGAYSAPSGDVTVDNGALNLAGSASLNTRRLLLGRGGSTGAMTMSTSNNLTVNFAGNWWDNGALALGQDNNAVGTLNMSGGTNAVTGAVWIGAWGGTGNWNQTGGTANITGSFWVGGMQDNDGAQPNGSIGTAIISNATLSAGSVIVGTGGAGSGANPPSLASSRVKGDLTVANGGVVNSEGDLQVGRSGSGSSGWGSYGTLNIENGGIVNVASTVERWMTVGRYNSIDATVNIKSGGTLSLNAGTDLQINEGDNSGIRVVNVEGLLQGTAASGSYIDLNRNATAGGTTTLNIMNGGVVAVDAIIGKANCTLNFDNGTLKAKASDPYYIGDGFTVNILSGGAILDTAGHNPTVRGNLLNNGIDEDGGLTKNGNGTLYLNGVNTYTNVTTVNAGLLGGIGTISGPVVVTAGGTLAPGASIGTLTLNGALTLAGNVAVEVDRTGSPTSDLCVINSGATYTGTGKSVIVTNLGPALEVGDTFQLFSAPVANGNLLTVTGGGATWTNKLALDGTITVLSLAPAVNPNPTNLTAAFTTTNVTLSWPESHKGWNLQVQTNSRSIGLTTNNWFTVPGSSTTNLVTIPTSQTDPTVFYRLQYLAP